MRARRRLCPASATCSCAFAPKTGNWRNPAFRRCWRFCAGRHMEDLCMPTASRCRAHSILQAVVLAMISVVTTNVAAQDGAADRESVGGQPYYPSRGGHDAPRRRDRPARYRTLRHDEPGGPAAEALGVQQFRHLSTVRPRKRPRRDSRQRAPHIRFNLRFRRPPHIGRRTGRDTERYRRRPARWTRNRRRGQHRAQAWLRRH